MQAKWNEFLSEWEKIFDWFEVLIEETVGRADIDRKIQISHLIKAKCHTVPFLTSNFCYHCFSETLNVLSKGYAFYTNIYWLFWKWNIYDLFKFLWYPYPNHHRYLTASTMQLFFKREREFAEFLYLCRHHTEWTDIFISFQNCSVYRENWQSLYMYYLQSLFFPKVENYKRFFKTKRFKISGILIKYIY